MKIFPSAPPLGRDARAHELCRALACIGSGTKVENKNGRRSPLSRGEACGSLPLAGTFGSLSMCAGQTGQLHSANMIHIGRVQSIETRGIPVLSLVAELNDNALIGGIQATRKTCLTWSLELWYNGSIILVRNHGDFLAFTVGP